MEAVTCPSCGYALTYEYVPEIGAPTCPACGHTFQAPDDDVLSEDEAAELYDRHLHRGEDGPVGPGYSVEH